MEYLINDNVSNGSSILQFKQKHIQNQTHYDTMKSIKSTITQTKLPNGYSNQKYFKRYIRTQYMLTATWTINFLMILVWFELDIQDSQLSEWLLYCSFLFHLLSCFILCLSYKTYNDFKIIQNNQYQTKKIWYLILQIFVLSIRPLPFINDIQFGFDSNLRLETNFQIQILQVHKLNHLFCIWSVAQTFVIFPFFFITSKYQNLRSNRICNMYGTKATLIYSIKSLFKQNQTLLINLIFFIWMLLCAQAIRIAEYQYTSKFKSFQNSLWMTFITMVSVGYGQFSPRTFVGKAVGVFSMYTGVLITSIILIIVNNKFLMNNRQRRSLRILNNLERKHQIRIVAGQYLKQALWRVWVNKKNKKNKFPISPIPATLRQRKLKQLFHSLRNTQHISNITSDIKDQFQTNFQKLFSYLDNLQENQQRIINYMHQRR